MNVGEIETVTLAKMMAFDFSVLMKPASPGTPHEALDPKTGITARMSIAGRRLFEAHGAASFERCAATSSRASRRRSRN